MLLEGYKFEQNNSTMALNYMLKNKNISSLHFKTQLQAQKINHSFNDSKRKRMVLSCGNKTSTIINRNNTKP